MQISSSSGPTQPLRRAALLAHRSPFKYLLSAMFVTQAALSFSGKLAGKPSRQRRPAQFNCLPVFSILIVCL